MNWQNLIRNLIGSGLTEKAISNKLKALNAGIEQPHVNRIKRGEIKIPRYDVGDALKKIAAEAGVDDAGAGADADAEQGEAA